MAKELLTAATASIKTPKIIIIKIVETQIYRHDKIKLLREEKGVRIF